MKQRTAAESTIPQGPFLFRARRVELGFSQEELARRSGVSAVTIGHLERGDEVRIATLDRLAPHLELTPIEALQMLAQQRSHGPSANEP